MNFKLKDIESNPFRDLKRNPLNPEKVQELRASIHDTGFWDNVLARMGPKGKPQIAYGHHRIEAARLEGLEEVGLILRELTDAEMLKIMARENSETYRYSVLALLESVRGVVTALADGRITEKELPAPGSDTNVQHVRYAPSFLAGVPSPKLGERPYTATSVAVFLGQAKKKNKEADKDTSAALRALQLIELGQLTEKEVRDLNIDQLDKVTLDRMRLGEAKIELEKRKQKAAEESGKQIATLIKNQQKATKEAEAQFEREVQELTDAAEKADEEERQRLAAETKSRKEREAKATEEREEKRKELEKEKKAQALAAEKAAAAQVEEKKKQASKKKAQGSANTYFPHLTQLITCCEKLFEDDRYLQLAAEAVRDRQSFTKEQKTTLAKVWLEAVKRGNACIAKITK